MNPTEEQIALLSTFGFPTSFIDLTDEIYFAIYDKMNEELMVHGINEAGDGLNEYGALCQSILEALPDD